ncbi:uncharacterized protein LOC127873552 [Dreissena polymorpha]|uniref:uncharacterized protein LOC127873552 n=1 Tax=Dreissena polymorpha TaxID=45954 RepID=UPI00226428C0|nr:uncharacterized protein LOC127873552 [Dreissena polymorpha]
MSVRVKYADVKGLMSLPGVSERQAWNIVQKQQKHGYLDMNMLSEDEADDEERIAGFTLSHPFPMDPAAVGYPKKEETTKLRSSVARDRKSCNRRSRAREEGRDSLERRHFSRDRSYSPRRSYQSPSRSRDGKHEYHYRKRSSLHDRSPEDYRRRSSGGRRRHGSRDRESDRDHYRRRHDHHSGHHRRSKFFYSDSDSDSDEKYRTLRGREEKRGNPDKLPKNLRYDGKSYWLSFKQKFDSYRSVNSWTDSECRDYLNWCLKGKALDFFTITTQMGDMFSFSEIMRKMEARFGAKELSETARVKFQQATQNAGESLEDWADRVLTLAIPAFRKLPEKHNMQEAISKFCQGCVDKEAGKHACFGRPHSMKKAIDLVRHHQYVTQAVDGTGMSDSYAVTAVSGEEDRLQRLERMVECLTSTVLTCSQPSRSGSDKRCYKCGEVGHFRKDCQTQQDDKIKKGRESGKGQSPLNSRRAFDIGRTSPPKKVKGQHTSVFSVCRVSLVSSKNTEECLEVGAYSPPQVHSVPEFSYPVPDVGFSSPVLIRNNKEKCLEEGAYCSPQVHSGPEISIEVLVDNNKEESLEEVAYCSPQVNLVPEILTPVLDVKQKLSKKDGYSCEQATDVICSTISEGELRRYQFDSENVEIAITLKEEYLQSIVGMNDEHCDFQDDCTQDEHYLGNFSDIEHSIYTGSAKPVKPRIRRTPACLAGEEEHLERILDAGVVTESTSEWVSEPVLIRKREGTDRWCIDRCALNNVTVKDTFPLPIVEDCWYTLSGNIQSGDRLHSGGFTLLPELDRTSGGFPLLPESKDASGGFPLLSDGSRCPLSMDVIFVWDPGGKQATGPST